MNAACRLSEHLLYLTQSGRSALGRTSVQFGRLNGLLNLIEGPDWHVDLPPQAVANQSCRERQNTLAALITLIQETQDLLKSAAELEPATEPRQGLVQAANALGVAHGRLQQKASELNSLVAQTTTLPSGHIFVTSAIAESLQSTNNLLQDLATELAQQADHVGQPGWAGVVTALQHAFDSNTVADSAESQLNKEDSGAILEKLAAEVEAMVQAELLWAQNTLTDKPSTTVVTPGDATIEESNEEAQQLPAAMESTSKTLGVAYLTNIADHATTALSFLAGLADSGDSSKIESGAAMLTAVVPMLRLLRAAVWQAAARCLALHRSMAKLTYITSALFAGIMEQGFCMPEGGEEGEAEEGDAKLTQGTGLGEGDTTDAKDISDELEDEDQLLGAQQKGQEEKEEPAEAQPQGADGPKGVEMDEDFDGALEDLQADENEEQEDGPEDEGEEDRLDQQMGDVGDAGEDVDERLWNGEDEEEQDAQNKVRKPPRV